MVPGFCASRSADPVAARWKLPGRTAAGPPHGHGGDGPTAAPLAVKFLGRTIRSFTPRRPVRPRQIRDRASALPRAIWWTARSDHRQPRQQDIQVSVFDLLTIGAILGGDPHRPPLVPQEGPLVNQLADPVNLTGSEIHDVTPPGRPCPSRSASSASTALRRARSGARGGEPSRAEARLACSSRLARSSSPAVSPVTSCGRLRSGIGQLLYGRPARRAPGRACLA